MLIRTYQATDHNACLAIFRSNTPRYFDPEEEIALENWLTGKDEGRQSYTGNRAEYFYVAEKDGKIVGCAGFYLPENENRANMVWGMVENALHKQGIGKALFAYRLAQIDKLYPGTPVSLDTSQHTYSFFQKLGFKVTQIQKDFYGPGLDRYDMISENK